MDAKSTDSFQEKFAKLFLHFFYSIIYCIQGQIKRGAFVQKILTMGEKLDPGT
jgi:hypothetical protein